MKKEEWTMKKQTILGGQPLTLSLGEFDCPSNLQSRALFPTHRLLLNYPMTYIRTDFNQCVGDLEVSE